MDGQVMISKRSTIGNRDLAVEGIPTDIVQPLTEVTYDTDPLLGRSQRCW